LKNFLLKKFYSFRRKLLTIITPEFIWPKYVNIDGAKIKVRNEPYTFGIKLSLTKRLYEGPERNLLHNKDISGESVIELGGSIGVLTAYLANKVGEKGKVISVEASKRVSAHSRMWLEKNQNTKIFTGYAFPVSKIHNNIKINNFDDSGNSMQGIVNYELYEGSGYNNSLIYDIKKISDLGGIIPTILICDIEGSEQIIIEQKPDFPLSLKFILIELHPEIYGKIINDKIIRTIEQEGFLLIDSEGNVLAFERSLV
jgi:FkbM family methyltransferase